MEIWKYGKDKKYLTPYVFFYLKISKFTYEKKII